MHHSSRSHRPAHATVHVPPDGCDTTTVTLAQPIPELERATVYGEDRDHEVMDDFMRRRRTGAGRYLTPAEIERRSPFDLSDLLRGMPGGRIVSDGFDKPVLLRNCTPNVFIDGRHLQNGAQDVFALVSGGEIAGVEVYPSAITTPAQFLRFRMTTGSLSDAACGAVVVRTKAVPR